MKFYDRLTLDAPRRLDGGQLAVRARAARTGVYQYGGREVDPENTHGLRDQALVNVLRDDGTVFDERSVRSFIGKPVTDDHPASPVTTANWRDHARGTIMGAMRDGDYLAFDLLLTDASAIAKVDGGKRDLSNGYTSDLEFGDFTAPDGTKCQARQTSINGNHVALVDRGRAGPECAIKDGFALCDALPSTLLDNLKLEKPVKTILIDGLTVDMSNADTAIATVQTLIAARDAAAAEVKDLGAKITTLTADGQTKDGEIAALKTQLADAAVSPAKLNAMIASRAKVIDAAKAMGVEPDGDETEAQIKKMAVAKKMGDAAKDMSDAAIDGAFAAFAADTATHRPHAPSGSPVSFGDADKAANDARAKMIADMLNPKAS